MKINLGIFLGLAAFSASMAMAGSPTGWIGHAARDGISTGAWLGSYHKGNRAKQIYRSAGRSGSTSSAEDPQSSIFSVDTWYPSEGQEYFWQLESSTGTYWYYFPATGTYARR